ncbi:MAG: ROK family protein [Acidimicrobiales bacterium]
MATSPKPTVASQSSIRETNLAAVLRSVVAADAPLSRAGIAAATSLTRSTVSRLVDDLICAGMLREDRPPDTPGRGRPGIPLVLDDRLVGLGLELNVSYLAVTAITLSGRLLAHRTVRRQLMGADPAPTLAELATLAELVRAEIPAGHRVVGAGLAVPGILDRARHTVLRAPNLGWSEVPLHPLEARLDLPTPLLVANGADLAAVTVAQAAPGRSSGLTDFLFLFGQIGIGGAAVVNGELLTGRHGWAGEVGHVTVDPNGPACRCGSTGCLEQFAGQVALLEAAGLPLDTAPDEVLALTRTDSRVLAAVEHAGWALGVAVASTINVLDLPVVVIGGHLGEIGPALRGPMLEQLRQRTLWAPWVEPEVLVTSGEVPAAALGAAFRPLNETLAAPARHLG